MNTKHTPGPWIAVANRPNENIKLDRVKSQDGRNVAFIPEFEHRLVEEQANAHLIAAAPELLEVVQSLVSGWDGSGACINVEATVFKKARAAIAKATNTTKH